jgi:NAD+ synthase
MAKPERIALWMRSQMSVAGARGFVVGLSGGIDSAVVARLAQMAAPGAVLGVILPCHSDPADERDALLVASKFSLTTTRVDLSASYDALAADLGTAQRLMPESMRVAPGDASRSRGVLSNLKPRLRMTALYYFANSLDYLVAGTGNRSELAVGYFTKYADGGVDLLPLGHLLKREVRELARDLGIRKPSAGLWQGQSDEDDLGFTYAELERYLQEGPQTVSPALAMRIERLARLSEHKRNLPPIPEGEARG